MPELSREPKKDCWSWHRQDREARQSKADSGLSLASWDETGALVLGRIEMRGKWLVLEVNSVARAERGKRMLTELLGGLIGKPVTETQSVESALDEHSARKRSPAKDDKPALAPDETARVMREFLERHYRGVIDEPLPAIGDVSPREAVGSPEAPEKVIRWFKYLENGDRRRDSEGGNSALRFHVDVARPRGDR
jgi:hypothetical protein